MEMVDQESKGLGTSMIFLGPELTLEVVVVMVVMGYYQFSEIQGRPTVENYLG